MRRITALTAAFLVTGVILLVVAQDGTPHWAVAASDAAGFAVAVLVAGLYVGTRRAYLAALRDRARQLERERDQSSALAAVEERARIAREMHDSVAHHLTVIVALSDGALRAVTRSPGEAADAIRDVSGTARQALTETRRLLGVLRADAGQLRHPLPGLADLDDLLGRVRAAGLPVRYERSGTSGDVPPAIQLAVFRLVQEALTNTMKHAGPGASAAVRVQLAAAEVRVDVEDDGAGRSSQAGATGGGLLGMRERIGVFGGDLEFGPRRPRGWRVTARLDLDPASGAMITVLLVDDHSLIRKGFRLILDAEPDIEVAGEASDGTMAVSMASALRPDVVLMDVRMPGRDGIEATRDIAAAGLLSKVLILTTFDLDDYVYAGLRAGASGFLLKDTQPDDLVSAIRTVASGDAVLAPGATKRLIRKFTAQQPQQPAAERAEQIRRALTGRELDVFALIAAGMSNGEIAARLHLSAGTVKVHVGRILAKLGLRDRIQAVVLAYESALIVAGTTRPTRPGDP